MMLWSLGIKECKHSAVVIPLFAQEQFFLSGACSMSRCCSVVSGCFQKPPAACVGWSSYMQSASSPGACSHGRERWMLVGSEGSWVFYSYSQHLAAVIHKRYSNSLPCNLFFLLL